MKEHNPGQYEADEKKGFRDSDTLHVAKYSHTIKDGLSIAVVQLLRSSF